MSAKSGNAAFEGSNLRGEGREERGLQSDRLVAWSSRKLAVP